jgi:hypothetical protein
MIKKIKKEKNIFLDDKKDKEGKEQFSFLPIHSTKSHLIVTLNFEAQLCSQKRKETEIGGD